MPSELPPMSECLFCLSVRMCECVVVVAVVVVAAVVGGGVEGSIYAQQSTFMSFVSAAGAKLLKSVHPGATLSLCCNSTTPCQPLPVLF